MKIHNNAGEKKAFELPPTGTHPARLIHIIDLGTHETPFVNAKTGLPKKQRQLRLTWELVECPMADGRNFVVGNTYTASLYKSNLLNAIESMMGQKLDLAEGEDFDAKTILGAPCMVTISHTKKGDKTYANIGALSPMPTIKGNKVEADPATNHLISFSLDEFDKDAFDMIPAWLQDKIKNSPEYALAAGDCGIPF